MLYGQRTDETQAKGLLETRHHAGLFGTAMSNVAVAFAILDLTGSKADVGYVLASQQLPKAVFLLLGGSRQTGFRGAE